MSPTACCAASIPTPVGAPIQGWGASYLFPIKGAAAFAAGEAETVEGIEVVDDHTLQVTLEQPTSTFLLGLTIATSWPVPQEAVEERGEDFANRPVGAGPFFVQEWNKGSDITIARNPGYVDPELPYLDEIRVDLGVDENTQVLRLESGEADGVFEQFAISPPALRLLQQNPDLTVVDSVGPRIFYLALNNEGIMASTGPAPGRGAGHDDRLHGPVRRPREALEPAHQLDDRAVRPGGHDDLRARPGGRHGVARVGRLRRHAGAHRLRRQRPLRLRQRHGAEAGPGSGGLHGGPEGPPEGGVLQHHLRPHRLRHLLDLLER